MLKWLLEKHLGERMYRLSNRTAVFERKADGGFDPKWSGFFCPPVKFLESYAYSLDGRDLPTPEKTIVRPWCAEHRFRIGKAASKDAGQARLTETVFVPRKGSSLVSVIEVENRGPRRSFTLAAEPRASMRILGDSSLKECVPSVASIGEGAGEKKALRIEVTGEKLFLTMCFGRTRKNISVSSELRRVKFRKSAAAGKLTASFSLARGESAKIPLICSVSRASMDEATECCASLSSRWGRELSSLASEQEALSKSSCISTPDPAIDKAFQWSGISLSSLLHDSEIGLGIISGRPDMPELSGRDTCWSVLGLTDAGLFDQARECLKTLARLQAHRIPGRIMLDGTLRASYSAADVDPLFLIALNHYVRASGDTKILGFLEDSVKKSVSSLRTRHGLAHQRRRESWMSGHHGRSGSCIETHSLWAEGLKHHDIAMTVKLREKMSRFFRPDEGYFYDTILGSEDDALTANALVPLMFGHIGKAQAEVALTKIKKEFATGWGVRTRSRHDPGYAGYAAHMGAISRLATGWAACSFFAHGKPGTGEALLHAMTSGLDRDHVGYITECLDASNGRWLESGHQGAPHALFIWAVDEFLFGIKPDMLKGELMIEPRIPGDWSEASRRGKKVGGAVMSLVLRKSRKKGKEVREARIDFNRKPGFAVRFVFPKNVRKIRVGRKSYKGNEAVFRPARKNVVTGF